MASFGSRLKSLRESNNLTQEELGKVYNLTKTAISLYESDKRFPDLNVLKELAIYFGVSSDYLLGLSDQVPNIKREFVKENINLIFEDMTYEESARDITKKLDIPPEVYSPKNVRRLARGEFVPSSEEVSLLARYAEVSTNFFYRQNTAEDLKAEREKYQRDQQERQAVGLPVGIRDFVLAPDNIPYLEFAKDLKAKGINPKDILSFQLKYTNGT